MIEKCANPSCRTRFRYLHEGRLFVIEATGGLNVSGLSRDTGLTAKVGPSHYWLCDICCKTMAVRVGPQNRAQVMPIGDSVTQERAGDASIRRIAS
jgi:hypothetical protein